MEREGDLARVPLFDGSNYPAWKFRMLALLDEHELMDCIEQEVAEVEELEIKVEDTAEERQQKTKAVEKRKKKDKRCRSLLISRIHDSQLEYIHDKPTPKAIWIALQRIFERRSIASRLHLKKQLITLRQDGASLREHFLRFDRIVREYKSTGAGIDDLDIVCHLLLTLDSSYATVVTAIETMPEDALTLEFVKCRLLDEETKKKSADVESISMKPDAAAFSGSRARKHQQKQQKKVWKCFGCGQEGHRVAECPQKKKKNDGKKTSAHYGADDKGVCFVAADTIPKKQEVTWIIDSGSSEHIANDSELFDELIPMKKPMEIAVAKQGQSIVAKHRGVIRLRSVVNGESIPITLHDVLYIPEASVNLLSVRKIEINGLKIVFASGTVSIAQESGVVAIGKRRGKLYELDLHREGECVGKSSFYSCGRVPKQFELWHRRYGHLSAKNLETLVRDKMVVGLDVKPGAKGGDEIVCDSCIAGKQTRMPFSAREGRRSSRVLELVHSDVCGPVSPVSIDGENYFVTFIDDWSRFTVVYLMNSKDQVTSKFKEYEAYVSAKFGSKISRFRCDNGGEYRASAFRKFCKKKGIQIEWTVPYTPEQNGVSERMNRTLVEKARSMLEDSGIDKKFWGPAIQTAAFLSNRSPASALNSKQTPFEVWEGRKPDVHKLRAFGVDVYVHIPKEHRKKLDSKSWRGVFIGYSHNGYRVWDPQRKTVAVVRDVIFVENGRSGGSLLPERKTNQDYVRVPEIEDEADAASDVENEVAVQEIVDEENFDSCVEETIREDGEEATAENDQEDGEWREKRRQNRQSQRAESTPKSTPRPLRERQPPAWQRDFEMDYSGFALSAASFVENLPSSLTEMKKRPDWPKWEVAVQEEMTALEKNNTWSLTKIPEGRVPITCKWVFRLKRDEDGGENCYKARLVARGFTQRYGFDYAETYSPVAKLDTLRAVLAVANHEKMAVHQMDVKTAFLNGTIAEEIYMVQPEGFEKGKGLVCRLNRSLYGLKQASRAWNERFHVFVEKLGFKRGASDQCLYVKRTKTGLLFLVIYVDDILIIGSDLKEIEAVKRSLASEFEMKDLGEVKNFLGMKIERVVEDRYLRISQRAFLEGLLQRFNMQECKPISTPIECRLRLPKGEESKRSEKPYRELVGCLMYVAMTSRPDLCAAVIYFSQFQSCPMEEHWVHLKRVLRYIRGTLDFGLEFRGNNEAPIMEAFCDADWANDPVDRRSLTGYVFRVHGCTVGWLTRKQPTVSLSSTEAELVALSVTICHGIWMKRLLQDLGRELKGPVTYYEDNQSTIRVTEDERYAGRMKHVDVKHRFVRELIQRGQVALRYKATEEQLADVLTKGLPAGVFQRHRASLGLKASGN